MGEVPGGREPYYFGVSITRCRDVAVILMFEGHYYLISDMGKAQALVNEFATKLAEATVSAATTGQE